LNTKGEGFCELERQGVRDSEREKREERGDVNILIFPYGDMH
jgi:hypothetical protein